MAHPRTLALQLLAATIIFASGCSQDATTGGAAANSSKDGAVNKEQASGQLKPADEKLAAIYDRSCRSCHTVAATPAPLTGDLEAWTPRIAKGMPTLVGNVVNGFGGMPPFGLCMDCNEAQFEALITFMASGQ